MTYNELKYLENEKRRLNAFTRNIARAIEEATLQARREETMKHFEHCAFIDAWENGLREFLNHDGGPYLQHLWVTYIHELALAGYYNGSMDEQYEMYDVKCCHR